MFLMFSDDDTQLFLMYVQKSCWFPTIIALYSSLLPCNKEVFYQGRFSESFIVIFISAHVVNQTDIFGCYCYIE